MVLPAAGAEPPLPKLRIEPKTGGSILYIRNGSSQPLTAFVIELVGYPGSYYALWQDDIRGEAIAPDQEKTIEIVNMTVGAVPDYVKLEAAVYADGSTAGMPEKVKMLIARRQSSLETVRELIHRVTNSQEGKMPKEMAATTLRRASEFMIAATNIDKKSQHAVNQMAAYGLYMDTAAYLDEHSMEETLEKLKAWEKALAESKPAL
jgi:hypothetical protein